jgi:urease accessory protein
MSVQFPENKPAGHGIVHVSSSPPEFRTITYTYPIKLIAPSSLIYNSRTIHTLFLLTYGGGLVAGDSINLMITLEPETRLILLTQGSTKVFKTTDPNILSSQHMSTYLAAGSALCYLPDPVQPFKDSSFEQSQLYYLDAEDASVCVCDWVSSGRPARGERWDFWRYKSLNEVWDVERNGKRRLLIRDNLLLEGHETLISGNLAAKVGDLGVIGTLILRGIAFEPLASFFIQEFEAMARIGEKKWDDDEVTEPIADSFEAWRSWRENQEKTDGVLWTAARVRGFLLVKFGAKEVEGAKRWLRTMLHREGSVETQFGERAILCLK